MSPSPQRPRRAREGYGAEEKLDGSNSLNSLFGGDGDGDGDRGRALVGGQPPVDPSTCTFWCAVGIGALVKGRPIESVSAGTIVRMFLCVCVPSIVSLAGSQKAKYHTYEVRVVGAKGLLHRSNLRLCKCFSNWTSLIHQ